MEAISSPSPFKRRSRSRVPYVAVATAATAAVLIYRWRRQLLSLANVLVDASDATRDVSYAARLISSDLRTYLTSGGAEDPPQSLCKLLTLLSCAEAKVICTNSNLECRAGVGPA
jgi:hypothetical protein